MLYRAYRMLTMTKMLGKPSPEDRCHLLAAMTYSSPENRIVTDVTGRSRRSLLRPGKSSVDRFRWSFSCHKWRIFGGATIGLAPLGGAAIGLATSGSGKLRPLCRYMQQETSLYDLQAKEPPNAYAIVGDYRLTVDRAQGVVHFYKGRKEWGRLDRSVPVEKWSGDWLIRTVGRFFQINYQLDQNKAIATIQQNGYLTVVVAHRIGQATLYKRLLIDSLWDYAVNYCGDVGFDVTVGGAIAELRQKLSARAQGEQAEVVLRVGAGSRFSKEALVDFCTANELTPGGRYTKQQLRQSVLRHRKLNCQQYRDQLNYFGIRINCR